MQKLFSSVYFKKATVIVGVILFLLSILIVFDSRPFLKFGYFGIFIFHLLGAGSILTFGVARYLNPVNLAFVTALGMAFNDSLMWLVGRNSDVFIGRSEKAKKIEGTLHRWGPFALFFWSLIPFPYDPIGFIAGYMEFPYIRFFLPTFLGKFTRTLIIGLGITIGFR